MKEYTATIGFFDGVHRGHRYLIDKVRATAAKAGTQSMAITFDRHPRQVLQASYVPQMLSTLDMKVRMLQATGIDSVQVLPFTTELAGLSARQFMQQVLRNTLHVRQLVIGYDNRFGHNRAEGFDQYVQYGREMGIEVLPADALVLDGVKVSSSEVRRLLAEGRVADAAQCLGYAYTLHGTVTHGFAEGRKIGFPTANLDTSSCPIMLPASGVYAARVGFADEPCTRPAMLNIGTRPTFQGTHTTIEAHLFHFHDNVYGQPMHIALLHHLREEQRFSAIEALEQQLKADRQQAMRMLEESE